MSEVHKRQNNTLTQFLTQRLQMQRARFQSRTTSLRTRYEGAHGNVRHVHERPSRELPLDRGIDYDQLQLP